MHYTEQDIFDLKAQSERHYRDSPKLALALARQAYGVARQIGTPHARALGHLVLGNAHAFSDDLARVRVSMRHYQRAGPLFDQSGDAHRKARMQISVVYALAQLDETEQAIALAGEAEPVLRAADDWYGLARLLFNLGSAYDVQGDAEKALTTHDQGLLILEKLPQQDYDIGRVHINRSVALLNLNEFVEAECALEMARGAFLSNADENAVDIAKLTFSIGNARAAQMQYQEAIPAYEQALNDAVVLEQHSQAQLIRLFLALAQVNSGDSVHIAKGYMALTAILSSLDRLGLQIERGLALLGLIRAHIQRQEWQSAEQMLKRVMGLASATGLTRIRIQAHLMAAEVAETVGVSQQAQQELTQAITLIAEHESDVRDETHRASWFSDKLIPFHRLVRLLNAQGDITSALEIAQQAKARELRRSLESEADSVSRQLQAISPALAHQIAQLRDELGLHQRQMRLSRWRAEISDDPDAAMSEVALKANAARVAEEWLRMAVAQAHQQLPSRARRVLGWRAADLAKTLAPNERLIEYLWGEDCIWAWAVTQDGIQDHCLISNITQVKLWCGGYEQAIRRALSQWASPMAQRLAPKLLQDIQDIGQALYKTLIGQFGASALAEGRGPHDTWIIAADGPLNHIPFHALPQPNGAPLLHAVDVRYVPGAALMQPPIPHQPIRAVGIAGAAEHAEHARRELDAAQTCFGNLQRWEGEAVDGLHLHEVLSGRNWVHLATHAAVHPRNPMLSSFALGGRDVTLAEVMELDLKRACVVLSACETGLGLHKGSDVFSLARGFMRAGATTLITSQWRVTSEITAELMRTFYAQVAQRQTVTQALRAAQLAMRAQGDHPLHAHPAYWAPMTVFGADRIPIDLSAS